MHIELHKHKSKNKHKKDFLINSSLIIFVACVFIFLAIYYRQVSGFIVMYNIEKSKDIKYPLSISESFKTFLKIKGLICKNKIQHNQQNLFFNSKILIFDDRPLTNTESNISSCLEAIDKIDTQEVELKEKLAYMLHTIYSPGIHILEADQKHKKFKEPINKNNRKHTEHIESLIQEMCKNNHQQFYLASSLMLAESLKLNDKKLKYIIDNLEKKQSLAKLDSKTIINKYKKGFPDIKNANLDNEDLYQYLDIIARLILAIHLNSQLPNYSLYTIKNDIAFYFDSLYNLI